MSCRGSLLVRGLVFDAVIWVWVQYNHLDKGDIHVMDSVILKLGREVTTYNYFVAFPCVTLRWRRLGYPLHPSLGTKPHGLKWSCEKEECVHTLKGFDERYAKRTKQQPHEVLALLKGIAKTNLDVSDLCDCVCFVDCYMVHICVEYTWIVCVRLVLPWS